MAFGLWYAELDAKGLTPGLSGNKITADLKEIGRIAGGKSNIGYLMEWTEFYAPAVLYDLQAANLIAKVVTNPFKLTIANGTKTFGYGSILVPVAMQTMSSDSLYRTVKAAAEKYGITIHAIASGVVLEGSSLGSRKVVPLSKPSIATLVGGTVSPLDAGEVWHLLDQRFNIPSTHLDVSSFNRVDLNKYNTLIMVSAQSYADLNKDKLKTWVQGGGTLILAEEAVQWASQNGIGNAVLKKTKSPVDSTQGLPYVQREQIEGAQSMSGAIFRAEVDLTHPLGYGYLQPFVPLFKANNIYPERSKNPFATPFYFGSNPLESGWLSRENYESLKNSAAVVVKSIGAGKVISIAANPNLRAFWLGGTKLLMNAIFFGRIIDAGSARTEE